MKAKIAASYPKSDTWNAPKVTGLFIAAAMSDVIREDASLPRKMKSRTVILTCFSSDGTKVLKQ